MSDDCDSKLHFDTRQFFHLKWERPEDLRATLAEHIKSTIGLGLADYRPIPRLPETVRDDRLAEWRRLLRLSPTQGRAVIQRAIRGRITFTPIPGTGLRPDPSGSTEIGGYEFEAETRFDRLFFGLVVPKPEPRASGARKSFIDPNDRTGTEDFVPSDADYNSVLERAYRRSAGVKANGWRPQRVQPCRVRCWFGYRPGAGTGRRRAGLSPGITRKRQPCTGATAADRGRYRHF
jgi:hypothetical protein